MKTTIIKNYINGLCSYLDDNNIQWEQVGSGEQIRIYYHNEEDLFRIGFLFGREYERASE